MLPRFGTWLESTGDLQEAFGVDWEVLRADPVALANYITWNFTALYEELGEMSHELPWAPWKKDRGILRGDARLRAIDEAVDALHFLANILSALDVSDDVLSDAYVAKQRINRARLGSGRSLPTPARRDDGHDPMIPSGARMVPPKSAMHYIECPAYGGAGGTCICPKLGRT